MAGKLSGGAIQAGTITTTQISSALNTTISAGGGPKISTIIYPGDDTAANTNGGQTLYITGSGFKSNSTVYINGNNVPSVSFISASNLSFTGPVLSAATYPVYVINPEDGATAILIPGLQVSGEPTWVTSATLAEQDATGTWNISLSATGDAPLTYALAAGSSLPGGITLASNGVISGTITTPPETDTTYNFTVDAIDAQNQSSSRAFSVTATTGEGAAFANNVLLIHADGTNNGNNHAFIDSSANNLTITRNGNITQGSYSPFSQTGWSAYFDGTGDYLKYAENNSAITNWYSQSTTIEAWVYPTSSVTYTNDYPSIVTNAATSGTTNYWAFGINGTKLRFAYFSGSGQSVQSTGNVSLNAWTHIAFVYNSSDNSIKLYINGILDGSSTKSGSPQSDAALGLLTGGWGGGSFAGYISNLRIVTGSAVYTNNFTPSIAPLATTSSNTSLLALQSNRLIDNGPNNFALTRNGDVSVQAFSPFAPGLLSSNSHSVYFDGTGDYLNVANATAFNLSTGDWTIECWINLSVLASEARIWSLGTYGSNPEVTLLIGGGGAGGSSNDLQLNYLGSSTLITASSVNSVGVWAHVAVVRSSGTTTLYVNGVSKGTTTTNPWTSSSTSFWIGGWSQNNNQMSGSISNLRVVKGTAVYTSAFTPPTSALTAITNTSLLTCQSSSFIDNSTNAFTISSNGNVVPRRFNPFGQTYTNTAYATSTVGGSGYFDGTGDFLSWTGTTIGTQPYTAELWFYPRSIGSSIALFGTTAGTGFNLRIGSSTTISVDAYNNSATQFTVPTMTVGQWYHLVAVRNASNATTVYLNGVRSSTGTATISTNYAATSKLGQSAEITDFNGYISGAKLTIGSALYDPNSTAIAIPTAPPSVSTNTAIMVNFTNAQIFDQTAKNVLECVGDAKVSTAQYKYGTASMYFDGTGDWLYIPNRPFLEFGTNDFTIECWLYANSMTGWRYIISQGGGSDAFLVAMNNTTFYVSIYGGTNTTYSSSMGTGQWYHLAVTRSSGTTRVFLDGVLLGSSTSSLPFATGRSLQIGVNPASSGEYWNGYIDDLRITKGYARYTSNFTPPTSALKDR